MTASKPLTQGELDHLLHKELTENDVNVTKTFTIQKRRFVK